MSIRNNIMLGCVILGVSAGLAFADADIDVTVAPPAAKVETVPPARSGYVWAPGYWKWEEGQHVWVAGHWVEAQVHATWMPDHWTEDSDRPGHWHFTAGHWERD